EPGGTDQWLFLRQFVPRSVTKAILKIIVTVRNPFDAMALPANLCGFLRFEFGRIHDRGIRLPSEVMQVTLGEISMLSRVLFRGAVARFASDGQFASARLELSSARIGPWLPGGGVAVNAVQIPGLMDRGYGRIAQKGILKWSPALILDEPDKREEGLPIARL